MGLLDTVKGWFGGGKAKVQGTVSTHAEFISPRAQLLNQSPELVNC